LVTGSGAIGETIDSIKLPDLTPHHSADLVPAVHLQANPTRAIRGPLRDEADGVRGEYRRWGLRRTYEEYEGVTFSGEGDPLQTIDWSAQRPVQHGEERFLRFGESFRSDRFLPKSTRRTFAYDGQIARVRSTTRLHNGPLHNMSMPFPDNFAPLLPHCLLAPPMFAPEIDWIFGESEVQAATGTTSVDGEVQVAAEELDGHRCWHVSWRAVRDDEGGVTTFCDVFLARDRGLLPLYQVFRTPVSVDTVEHATISMDAFQREPQTGRWFPRKASAVRQVGEVAWLTRLTFEIDRSDRQPEIFSNVPAVNGEHVAPPAAAVAPFAAQPILTQLPGPGTHSVEAVQEFRLKFALSAALLVIAALGVVAATLTYTRLGRLSREFFRRHRNLVGWTGLVFTIAFASLCTMPPGWSRFGLTLMMSGGFALAWIALSVVLWGDRKLSIRTALAIAAATALLFAGYSAGIRRMETRQRMIRQIRDRGGEVVIGLWRLDEEGLLLPRFLERLLGEAWTGRASRAAVEQRQFNAETMRRWCLDEVRWLGVASAEGKRFEIDGESIAELRDTRGLWTFHVEGGRLTGTAFEELKRFDRLIDLYFDCHGRDVARQIGELPELERLWLTHAVVNDDLVNKLARIETLEQLTLIAPRFENLERVDPRLQLKVIAVRNTDLSPRDMEILGKFPAELELSDCRFQFGQDSPVVLDHTPILAIRNSDLDNESLARLSRSPTLGFVDLTHTNVSAAGVEAFSELRPDVLVMIE
jgi:hypothetical protein